jgi:hypothetical protein
LISGIKFWFLEMLLTAKPLTVKCKQLFFLSHNKMVKFDKPINFVSQTHSVLGNRGIPTFLILNLKPSHGFMKGKILCVELVKIFQT